MMIEFDQVLKQPSLFANFAENEFIEICVLSGCDYLNSIKGLGLIRSIKLMKEYRNVELIINSIKSKTEIPENYLERFQIAVSIYYEQIVYNPKTKALTGFVREPKTKEAGTFMSNQKAQAIAEGKINPKKS